MIMDKQKKNKRQNEWNKENTLQYTVKLQKSTDSDIIAYLDGKVRQAETKKALRLLIEKETENN